MTKILTHTHCLVLSLVLVLGCSQQPGQSGGPPPDAAKPPTSEYLLASEPSGAKGVAEARKSAKTNDQVVVVGRIGGDANPWVEGVAAFLIADTSLTPCNARPGDSCPTPWDYCCDLDLLKSAKAMVKVVDREGRLLKTDARKLMPLKELQTVVVHGRAERDEAGNLTIFADGVFIRS